MATNKLKQMMAEAMEKAKTCDHPKDQQQQIGFGIFCMKCQIRLRLLTKEEGERKIMGDLKQFMGGRF